ncbi:MAG: phage tail tip lysozyme [Ruminococcus flavefaciens]|nr:phage tail tip lysozyme [Ruminococcus flavefaciens]
MAHSTGNDRMTMDIRAELKKAAAKGGRYFTGTARMFLDSTTEAVGNSMPTVGAMLSTNQAIVNDTLKFLRNPVDALNRGIDKINQNENIKAMRKFAADAIDDLKTGNIYDPDRDRSGFGMNVDSLLDNFGDFDMSGFDDSGDYAEPDVAGFDHDEKLMESHEQADDVRTTATIDAVQGVGTAVVANANVNAQADIRLGIKQHSQIMSGMSNVITQQGALLDSVNAAATSLLEVQREAHQDVMNSLNSIVDILGAIRVQTGPPEKEEKARIENDTVFGVHGELDIRKWLTSVKRNADEKYGISSALSMATMGMSPKQLIELVADNPWKLVSDQIVSKVIPEYLKNTMTTTQKYMESFFPSLLAKWADQGKRFDKDPTEGGGRLIDLVAGIFGVQPRKGGYFDLTPQDINKKAEITNRFTTAVEKVIPMWLSKIYSAISGEPLSMYNYVKGEVQSVTKTVSDTIHDSNDLVGRMGAGARNFYNRATDKSAFQFVDPEMEKQWENYLYRFMQRAAENGSFLNYGKSKDEFMDMMPDDVNKELWYKMITATLSHMPKNEVMALNAEINKARFNQRQADERITDELRDSGMDIAHAMVNPELKAGIENSTILYRRGLDDTQLTNIVEENQREAATRGLGLKATNQYLSDITSMLKRGILTYTHIIGDDHNRDPNDPVDSPYQDILDQARDETTRVHDVIARRNQPEIDERNRREESIQANRGKQITDRANNKVWIGEHVRPDEIDQTALDLAQGSLVIKQTRAGMSDNKLTEEQRLREERQDKIKGMAEGRINRIKDAFKINEGDTFGQRVGKVLESPFALFDLGLRTVDQFLFKIVYGEDAPVDLDDPDHPERDQKARSLMDTMTRKMKAQWASTKEWFKEYIGTPIKDFFLGEQGLLGKVKSKLLDRVIDPAMDKVGEIKTNVKNKLLGTQEIVEKYVDDPDHPGEKKLVQEKGDYQGGIFSGAANKLRSKKAEIVSNAKDKGMSWLDTLLYDNDIGKANKGRYYSPDEIELDDDMRQVITEGHYEYYGLVGGFKEQVDKFKDMLFGPDENGDDHGSRAKYETVKGEFQKAFPDMTIGAGVGLIGSIFLPGGPIIGSILGATGGLVAGSDKLKNYLFGEEEMDHEYTEYNWKTGKIETVKGKGRKGGIINSEIQDAFKKFAPKMAIGAGVGVIGSMFLPGGPVIGSILGATGGMVAASDRIKQIIFGDGTVGEDGKEKGIIPPSTRKAIVDAVKKNAPGVLGGAAAGAKLGSMLGAGLGLIPGLSLLPTGPIFTLLGGITGAIGGNTIQEMFFGKESEVEEKDPETGEVKKVKKRVGGLFGRAYDYVQNKIFTPFGHKMTEMGDKVKSWFSTDVVGPLAHVADPLRDAIDKTKSDVQDAFRHMGEHIKNSLDSTFENAFGKKMGEFFEEKIKKPLSNMVSRILGGIGKAIGAVISAPFKLLDYMVTGNTDKVDENGNVIDKILDSDETASDKPKRKRGGLKNLGKRFMAWRDKGTEEANQTMRETKRYWDHTVEDYMPKGPTDREQAREAEAAYKEQARIEKEERKARRAQMFASVRERWGKIWNGDDNPAEPVGGMSDTLRKMQEKSRKDREAQAIKEAKDQQKREREEARAKRKQEKLDKRQARKDKRSAKSEKPDENLAGTVAEGTEASQTEEVKKGKQKGRNAVSYLKSIDRTTRNIYKEIKGNLNGVGWNIAYIKTQFDKHLGKLKSDELPEEMEGSTKGKVRKRRTIIGRALDTAADFGGRVMDRVGDMKDAAVEKVKDAIGFVVKPFKMLGSAAHAAYEGLKTFGGGLLTILGKLGVGLAEGIAKTVKGAGELIGKTLGGVGRMIWHAGAGIGKALGNTVALVTDVVKNFGSAVAAGIAGVARVAATVVPDIATGIWKGVTGTAGFLWKGVKWGGGKLLDAGKWALGKITGKGKKKDKEVATANKKISDAIVGGYMAMGIGHKKNIQPYPYVRFAGSKLLSKLNDVAIPVWIMGSSSSKGSDTPSDQTGHSSGFDYDAAERSMNAEMRQMGDSLGSSSANIATTKHGLSYQIPDIKDDPFGHLTQRPVDEADFWKRWSEQYDAEHGIDSDFYKALERSRRDQEKRARKQERDLARIERKEKRDAEKGLKSGGPSINGTTATPKTEDGSGGGSGGGFNTKAVDLLTDIRDTLDDFYSDWKGRGSSGGGSGGSGAPIGPSDATPTNNDDDDVTDSFRKRVNERKRFHFWKKGYTNVDNKAERSNDPAEVYDQAIKHANNKEEAEGIVAAEAMNDGKLGNLFTGGSGEGAKEESKGLLETLFGDEGGGGIMDTVLGALGLSGASKAIRTLFNFGKNGATDAGKVSVWQSFTETVKNNIPFLAGTTKAVINEDYSRVATNTARQTTSKFLPWLGKSLLDGVKHSTGELVDSPGARRKLGSKLVQFVRDALVKFSKDGAWIFQKIGPNANKNFAKLCETLLKQLDDAAVRLTSESIEQLLKNATLVIKVATAIWDFTVGQQMCREYFGVNNGDADEKMKKTAGMVRAVSGLCFGLLPETWLCNTIYQWIASESEKEELKENQSAYQKIVGMYNQITGQQLSNTDYAKKKQDSGESKNFDYWMKQISATLVDDTAIKLGETAESVAISGHNLLGRLFGWERWEQDEEKWDAMSRKAHGELTSDEVNERIADGTYEVDVNMDNKEYGKVTFAQFEDWAKRHNYTILTGKDGNYAIRDKNVFDHTPVYTLQKVGTNKIIQIPAHEFSDTQLSTATPTTTTTPTTTQTPTANSPVRTQTDPDMVINLAKTAAQQKPEHADAINAAITKYYNTARTDDDLNALIAEIASITNPGGGTGRWGTGRHVTPMDQTASKWNQFDPNMGKVGCGPTVAAMVGSAYGDRSATPADANAMSKSLGMRADDGGTNPAFFEQYAKGKSYGMTRGPVRPSDIAENLESGQPVITMGKGGAYGNNTHYLVADKVTGKGVSVVDPVGGARKNVSMKDLTSNASEAIYSYGKGPVAANTAVNDGGGGTVPNDSNAETEASKDAQITKAQNALVSQMEWLRQNPIQYSLGSVQDPDKGTASCASTVAWAYRNALGVNPGGSSGYASSTSQSKDPNFTTLWTNDGSGLTDTSFMKPGDIVYYHWGQSKNTGAMKHTEMYVGNDQDLSHGGPGRGPVYKQLNNYRRQHAMMVRRYTPLVTGEDIQQINSRGGGFGSNGVNSGGFGGTTGVGSFGTYESGTSTDENGNLTFQLGADGTFSFLNNLSSFFGTITNKLGGFLNNIMGIKNEDDAGVDTNGDGSSSGSSADPNFVPAPGGSVEGNDVTATVYNYLRSVGLSPIAASGTMGNLEAESGINPGNVQNGTYDKSLSHAEEDRKYIEDVTSGAHDFINDSKGYGLAQWTYHSRKRGLWDLIREQNAKLDDLAPQMQYLWNEINAMQLAAPLNNAKSVKEASNIMLHDYEGPADQSAKVEDYRAELSQKWYDLYAKNETPDPESTDDTAAKAPETDENQEEPGTAWGAGPGGISLGLESLNSTIANLNAFLSEQNAAATDANSVTAITQKITDSIDKTAGSGATASDAMFQAMAASLAQMVELLTTIADNTKKVDEKDPLNGGRSSPKDKPRITQYPSASPMNENGITHPTSIGAEIVDKMTANRR